MKNLLSILMASLCMIFLYACDTPGTDDDVDMDEVRAEIQAMEDAYAEAHNNRDAEAQVMNYYAEDAQTLPPNQPAIVGRDAILKDALAEMESMPDTSGTLRFEIVDLWASGDLAVEHGKWVYTAPDGEESTGKFITVFEKRDGKYVAVRDIYNSDDKYDDDEDEDDDDEDDDDEASEDEGG